MKIEKRDALQVVTESLKEDLKDSIYINKNDSLPDIDIDFKIDKARVIKEIK